MSRFSDIQILHEYGVNGKQYGAYHCKFNGEKKLFTKNDSSVKVLVHWIGHDELESVNDDVRDELLRELEDVRT